MAEWPSNAVHSWLQDSVATAASELITKLEGLMTDRQGLMRSYLDRVVVGDLEGAATHYTDAVVFHWAGKAPLSGDYEGKAAVLDMFAKFASSVESSVEPHDVLISDDHAVVLNRATYRRGGRSLTTNRVVVYHFSGDKISEVWVVDEKQREVDDFLS